MLKLYKKGKFDIAIYAIPSVILLVLVLLLFGTFFFTEFSKPSDLSIETRSINADISLISFLRTEIIFNNKNIKIYELIQPAYESQNSEEAKLLKEEYAKLRSITGECSFLKITSLDDKKDIVLIDNEYQPIQPTYSALCKYPNYPKELSYLLISNKDPNKKGFVAGIGE